MLIAAEIGSLHKQDQGLAYEMIRKAAEAGATTAKFQLGWPKEDIVRHIDPWAVFLAESCAFFGIEFMASIWSIDGLNIARMLKMKRYKVSHQVAASTDPEVKRLFAAILSDGKETFISGMPPVRGTIENARWLYCVPKYPAYPRDVQLPGGMGEDAEHVRESAVPPFLQSRLRDDPLDRATFIKEVGVFDQLVRGGRFDRDGFPADIQALN